MPAVKDDLYAIERRLDALLTGSWFLGTPSRADFAKDFMKQVVSWDDTRKFFLRLPEWLSQVKFYHGEGDAVAVHMATITIDDDLKTKALYLTNGANTLQYVLINKGSSAHSTSYEKKTASSEYEIPLFGAGPMTSVLHLKMAFSFLFGSFTYDGEKLGKELLEKCFP
jgi:hypothetical protein